MTTEIQLFQYNSIRPQYRRFSEKLADLIKELMSMHDIKGTVTFREKDPDSLSKKLNKPDKEYKNITEDITDLAGVRVVLSSLDDVNRVGTFIEKHFKVDHSRSINKLNSLNAHEFGYLSQHFIIKISPERGLLPDWSQFSNFWAEIQVRTELQHTWAAIQHKLAYKTERDIPEELKRRLFRVSALLELGDSELNSIIVDAERLTREYKKAISGSNLDININLDSLDAYIRESPTIEYWDDIIESLDFLTVPIEYEATNLSAIIETLNTLGIRSLHNLDLILREAKGWGEDFLTTLITRNWESTDRAMHRYTRKITAIRPIAIAKHHKLVTQELLDSLGYRFTQNLTKTIADFSIKIDAA